MAQPQPKSRKVTLYAELVKYVKAVDHEKAIKTCNRLLHEFPDEVKAFECKIICCTMVGRYSEVLEFTSKSPKLSGNLGFERAYCHYRLNNVTEAYDILDKMKENSLRKKELMCQILYRMERYDECLDKFREVIKNSNDQYDEERQTNFSAVCASISQLGADRKLPPVVTETFEQRYNYGCQLIGQGQVLEAEVVLEQAETLCVEFLKDDGAEEKDIDDEVAVIRIQRAYISQLLNRQKEALRLYTAELKKKPSDLGAVAVASNNVLTINRDQNIFESKRKIKSMNVDGLSYKITVYQRKAMLANIGLHYLGTNQGQLCEATYQKIMEEYPDDCEDGLCLWIAHVAKTKGLEAAKEVAGDSRIENNPELRFKVKLGLAQELLKNGKRTIAEELLEEIVVADYYPGVIGALVTLYVSDGQLKKAYDLLFTAVNFYKKTKDGKAKMILLWRQAATLMMRQGQYADAAKSLEELRTIAPDDLATLAQLVVAYSKYDTKKAVLLSKKLPPPPRVENQDLDLIESRNYRATLKALKKGENEAETPKQEKGEPTPTFQKRKTKKKKKTVLPKNYDPERKPDPERWLRLYERSGYNSKKVRAKGRVDKYDVAKGSQGMSSADSAAYDMGARAAASPSVAAAAGPSPKQKSSGGGGGGGRNKKSRNK